MGCVPRPRRLIIPKAHTVVMPDHRGACLAARPIPAGHVVSAREGAPVGLRSRQNVVLVRRVAPALDRLAPLGERRLFRDLVVRPMQMSTSCAMTSPFAFCHGPRP